MRGKRSWMCRSAICWWTATLHFGAVLEPARPVKLMKTAAAILEKARSNSLRRMVNMLIEQLVDIMPEFGEVTAWNTVGQRRTQDDYGRVVERQLPDDFGRRTTG